MKHIFLFLSILFAVQIGQAQEVWNACNSTVTIIPAPSYDSTFVLSAPSRAALAKGMANWTPSTSSAASYLVYAALLTQSGTDAPVATVLENTLGGTVVWTRADVGSYEGTLTGAFSSNAIAIPTTGIDPNVGYPSSYLCYISSSDAIGLETFSDQYTTNSDGILAGLAYIEIRVYQ